MKLWIVSMECAGISEAGGVKNVTYSLCKEFSALNHKVTLFVPVFGCNTWDDISDYEDLQPLSISICGKTEEVMYKKGHCVSGNFEVIFICHKVYKEKLGVYTYTEQEQALNPKHVKGNGHEDVAFMDVLFQKAVLEYSKIIPRSEVPEIIHCQDASTALIPGLVPQYKALKKTKSVVTIHNAGPYYHHEFSSLGEAAWYTGIDTPTLEKSLNKGKVEPFLVAATAGANVTTVSEDYAKEIINPLNVELTDGLAPIFAERKVQIEGITNGFDFDRYNPEHKEQSLLPFEYSPEQNDLEGKFKCRKFFIQNVINTDNFNLSGVKKYGKLECSTDNSKETYICYHGRVTSQKGISVLIEAIPSVVENYPDVRFIIAGQGEPALEDELVILTRKYPGKITYLNGYNKKIARLAVAVSDFIVLPSFFEPCGLEDFIAQVFGTIPIAHKTGGLNKIQDEKTGFLYVKNTSESLAAKIAHVMTLKELKPASISKLIKAGAASVRKEYQWKTVIQKKYLPYFKELLKKEEKNI